MKIFDGTFLAAYFELIANCVLISPQLAISMATKAASFARELKSIRSDLCFMQERCALLEEENRRLRDGLHKGLRPDEDDLVRLVCFDFSQWIFSDMR